MNDPLQGLDVQRQLSEILNVSAAALSSQDALRLQLQGLASFVADAARRAAPGAQGDEWAAAARLVRDVAEQLERANDGLARIEDMATALMLHAATAVKTEGHDAGLAEPPLQALCGQVDALDQRLREACDAARRGTLEARSQQTYYALKCRSLTVALDAARADGLARSALQHQLHDAYARLEHLEQMRQHAHGHDGSDGGARELDERDLELTQMALQVERLQRENETLREQRESVEQVGGGQAARLLEDRARLASEVERLKDENERLWARAQESDSRAEDVELLLITAHASSSSGDADGDGTVAQRPRTESRPERESVEEQAAVRKEWKERYDLQRIGLLTRARLRRQKMAILHRWAGFGTDQRRLRHRALMVFGRTFEVLKRLSFLEWHYLASTREQGGGGEWVSRVGRSPFHQDPDTREGRGQREDPVDVRKPAGDGAVGRSASRMHHSPPAVVPPQDIFQGREHDDRLESERAKEWEEDQRRLRARIKREEFLHFPLERKEGGEGGSASNVGEGRRGGRGRGGGPRGMTREEWALQKMEERRKKEYEHDEGSEAGTEGRGDRTGESQAQKQQVQSRSVLQEDSSSLPPAVAPLPWKTSADTPPTTQSPRKTGGVHNAVQGGYVSGLVPVSSLGIDPAGSTPWHGVAAELGFVTETHSSSGSENPPARPPPLPPTAPPMKTLPLTPPSAQNSTGNTADTQARVLKVTNPSGSKVPKVLNTQREGTGAARAAGRDGDVSETRKVPVLELVNVRGAAVGALNTPRNHPLKPRQSHDNMPRVLTPSPRRDVKVSARSGTNNNTWLQSPRDVNHVTLTQGSSEEDVRNVRKVRKSELKRAQEQAVNWALRKLQEKEEQNKLQSQTEHTAGSAVKQVRSEPVVLTPKRINVPNHNGSDSGSDVDCG